jgi:hypothetical protein
MSRLLLQWSHRKVSASLKLRRGPKDNIVLVRIPRDQQALGVRIRQPRHSKTYFLT